MLDVRVSGDTPVRTSSPRPLLGNDRQAERGTAGGKPSRTQSSRTVECRFLFPALPRRT